MKQDMVVTSLLIMCLEVVCSYLADWLLGFYSMLFLGTCFVSGCMVSYAGSLFFEQQT